MRTFVAATLALVIVVGGLSAAEVKGKIKTCDPEKGTITITTKEGDKTLAVSKDTKFTTGNKKVAEKLAAEGLRCKECIKPGANVTIITEGEGDKVVAKEIKVGGQPKPVEKDKPAEKKPVEKKPVEKKPVEKK